MKKPETAPRVLYFDYLRILATVAVIVIHVAAQNWYSVPVDSDAWKIFNLVDSAVRWGVPVFVMISGALFLNPDRPLDLKKLYTRNVLRIVTCFLFWSAVYALDLYLRGGGIKNALVALIQGHYHLWFLFMIAGIYVVSPLLRKLTEDRKTAEYFLLIGFLFTFLIPRGLNLLTLLDLPHTGTVVAALNVAFSNVNFHLTLGYTFYFVLGFYLERYGLRPLWRRFCYVFALLGFGATALLSDWYSNQTGVASTAFYQDLSVNVMLFSVGVFLFGKYVLSKIVLKGNLRKWVQNLSQYTMGIYLVHVLILQKFQEWWGFNTLTLHPLLSVVLLTVGVFVLSWAVSWILNHLPVLKKYIV